jgi:hypothetical protein
MEICDGLDNDCDTAWDEEVSCTDLYGDPVCPGSMGFDEGGCEPSQCRRCRCSSSLTWTACGPCVFCPI